MGRKLRAGRPRQSGCWSDNARAESGRPTAGLPASVHATGSSACWRRFHPRTPTAPGIPRPATHANPPVLRPRRDGSARRRAAFFLYVKPSRRSHKSTVEVRKGRSRRVPSSAKGGIGLRGHQLLQAGLPARGQQGFASALVSLGLQRAAFLELLPDPPHGGHTETKKLRNVVGAFALLIEVDDAFADRQWYGSQGNTLPHRHARVKLHVLWNCSNLSE